jgi:cell division protein FtsL
MLLISKFYGICMVVASLVWAILLLHHKDFAGLLTLAAPLLLHACAQLLYSFHSQRLLFLPRYEDLGTLDNHLFFDAPNNLIVENATWAIVLAAVASFFELCILFVSVRFLPAIGGAFSGEASYVLYAFICLVSLSMGVVTALYNLRTWNRKAVAH